MRSDIKKFSYPPPKKIEHPKIKNGDMSGDCNNSFTNSNCRKKRGKLKSKCKVDKKKNKKINDHDILHIWTSVQVVECTHGHNQQKQN